MMLKLLKRLLGRTPPPDSPAAVAVADMTDRDKMWRAIRKGKCPDCGATKGFFEGPSGGMCTNIFCAACGQGFNIAAVGGDALLCERIHRRGVSKLEAAVHDAKAFADGKISEAEYHSRVEGS